MKIVILYLWKKFNESQDALQSAQQMQNVQGSPVVRYVRAPDYLNVDVEKILLAEAELLVLCN